MRGAGPSQLLINTVIIFLSFRPWKVAIATLLVAAILSPALAQTTTTWISTSDTDFATGANWNSGAPANDLTSHVATFDGTGTANPVLAVSQSVQGLSFTGGSNSLSSTGGATLTTGAGGITSSSGNHTISAGVTIGTGTQTFTVASDTLTISGNIVSAGSSSYLTKEGAGTLVLTGTNAYSATNSRTTISAGTLQIGDGSTAGSLESHSILNNGALVFNRSDDVTLGKYAEISGSGTLTQAGSGTLVFTATPTHTGATIISAGTLQIRGRDDLVSSSITNNAALVFDQRGLSYAGVISGTGTIGKIDTGTLTLSGANTFSGSTTVSNGTLILTNALALQNSALDTSGAGVVTLSAVTTPTLGGLTGSTDLASVISTGYSGVTALTLNPGTGASKTYSGVIADGAAGMTLTKTGAGTQILSGANTYTGATTVSAGTLSINGSLNAGSTVTVATGGTLGGSGTINGATTIQSGGTLAPGNSPGILTFTNGLTLNSGSITQFEVNGPGRGTSYDAIDVTGGILTYGGGLTLNFGATITSGTTLDLFGLTNSAADSFAYITATDSYAGSFANSGGTWTLTSGGQLLTFVQSTGDLSFTTSAVPEPATYAVIFGALALAGTTLIRRRRRAA